MPSGLDSAPRQYCTLSIVVAAGDDALGEQKALRQFDIGARRAHGDRQRRAVDPDLQWLLDDEGLRPFGAVLGGRWLTRRRAVTRPIGQLPGRCAPARRC